MLNQNRINIFKIIITGLLIIIFVLIFFGGYILIFYLDKHTPTGSISVFSTDSPQNKNEVKKEYLNEQQYNELKNQLQQITENNLTVSKLSDFYACLFTAIAVIFAIIALLSWVNLRDKLLESQQLISGIKKDNNEQIEILKNTLNEAINEYKKVKNDVDVLRQKQKYAEWIQEKLDLEDIEISFDWDLSIEDKIKMNKYYRNFIKKQEENVLVGISIIKYLMSEGINKPDEVEEFYTVLEANTTLPNDSIVKPLLYRFLGQFQKQKYDNMKEAGNNQFLEDALRKSMQYYNMSITLSNETEQERSKENLAVVLIELGKLYLQRFLHSSQIDNQTEAFKYFEDAREILLNEKKKDFNTNWDLARVEFYTSDLVKTIEVEAYLQNVVNKIETKNESRIFIEKLRNEIKEFEAFNKKGFPGDEDIINNLELHLKNKIYVEM